MEGTFGGFHLIFLAISIIMMISSNIIMKKKLSEKSISIIIKIEAIIWLITILINRITVTHYNVEHNPDQYTWLNLIPNTFCGVCSLVLSITVICGKKDNFLYHSLGYLGLVGGIVTMIYPDFLDSQSFFDPRSWSGFLHHTLMAGVLIKLLIYGYITPTISKWSYFILGLCAIMTLGVVELDALGFAKAMQIKNPLIKSLPVLTSWYIVYLVMILAHFVFLVIYEKAKNKISLKEILKKVK